MSNLTPLSNAKLRATFRGSLREPPIKFENLKILIKKKSNRMKRMILRKILQIITLLD
jgi:hypothetical protein